MVNLQNDSDVVDLTDSPPGQQRQGAALDETEDADLKLAIALSLQQYAEDQSDDRSQSPVLVESKTPEEASRQTVMVLPTMESKSAVRKPDNLTTNLGGWLAVDRKTMEAERLGRLKRKREAGDKEEVSIKVRSVSPRKQHPVSPPPLRRAAHKLPASQRDDTKNLNTEMRATNTLSGLSVSFSNTTKLYPEGVVLKTHAPGYPTDRTISFNELIAPATSLKSCLLSSFIWDFDWLFPHFKTTSTNFLLVMHAKHPGERRQIESDFSGIPNIQICFPPMDGQINCMHSKLMLFFWDERCRVVVPTANLMDFDWGVGSVMENTVWLIDLPKIPDGRMIERTSFQDSLTTFLTAQTVPGRVLSKLELYDFGKTLNLGFVHSIGGAHTGDAWKETGHCGLSKAVKLLGLAHEGPIEVDFVTSSVGRLNDEFMRCMYLAAQGDEGLTELTLRTAKAFPATRIGLDALEQKMVAPTKQLVLPRGKMVAQSTGEAWKDRFRFYFPSQRAVEASNGGERKAGTICFAEKWWDGKFPKRAIRDCISVRNGLLMHNKMLLVRFPQAIRKDHTSCVGYAYVGSANLSESAWGRLVQDRITKQPKLNCRNWESGVLIPVPTPEATGLGDNGRPTPGPSQGLDVLSGTIPLPMKFPGDHYESSNRKPWFFENG